MTDRRTQKLGALVLAGAIAAAAAVVLLDGVDWRPTIRVLVFMEHAGPLGEGDPMIVAGREIGRIEAIELVPSTSDDHPLEGAGGVAIHVAIQKRYANMTSVNGEFFLERRGVFGRPYLAVGPPPEPAPWERSLRDGDRVRGVDPAQLDRVLRRVTASAAGLRALLAEVEPSVRSLGTELSDLAQTLRDIEPEEGAYARLADHLAAAGAQMSQLTAEVSMAGPLPMDEASALLARTAQELGAARARLGAAAAALDRARDQIPDDALERARAIVAEARASLGAIERITAEVQELLALVEAGRGTVGAILNDPQFSEDAKRIGQEILRHPWRVLGRPPERPPRR